MIAARPKAPWIGALFNQQSHRRGQKTNKNRKETEEDKGVIESQKGKKDRQIKRK
jgi:hypothetical protein